MDWIKEEIIDKVSIISVEPYDPVVVKNIPRGWELIGRGNFAAVFTHPSLPNKVVKIYAENKKGIEEEVKVYKKLGYHKSFSMLYTFGSRYLVLERLEGVTLYQAFIEGIFIPKSVLGDVDDAIKYATKQGLNPTDIHGKNVIMLNGHGYIVDVSDFLKPYKCPKWRHLKRIYTLLYFPLYKLHPFSIPITLIERIRKSYQFYLVISGFRKKQQAYERNSIK
ncbi:hypothetical protein [Bacillus weihaiensis]|uniref:Serine/threonine protein kinase n=1 Tax=Bacillus weihaiensis TaxID=1547283 RepID=A0A1L3MQZ6_9BACI|nr:hypothetical protein [Bacillus weihaiensis]APH04758.1 hypothetical protein A9C19_08370 [Bacillus weihaiensis]